MASIEDSVDIPPNQTIYVNNLYEKISKKKLREHLYSLFSKYGQILEIEASKSLKMRGQAFIVFKDITSASNALREMNGFNFLDRPMKIQYSKNKSDAVSKLDGTYMEKKRQREENNEKKINIKKQDRKVTGGQKNKNGETLSVGNIPSNLQPRDLPPNKTLFVENLPDKCDPMMLEMLFSQFPGYKEVHMVESKKGIAFVEFQDESKSGLAMQSLQHFKVTQEKPMVISFAKQ
ncbi:hypothetical protein DICPUDRAFT_83777 [Dictyostelium purpureum]|uniref:RRM domain-containing protein n=1 Tax=Dictyostelium purpureum TaxID=5786 RepID=F1A0L1_DICPU|nr:uncharacterized protein DICPUDRAFT_83777 [Dictyostelium purpureum]EGC30273.1 hypothetical protein DICPUDRAFT_83777 [Dictyostelium purpureum]|eukprot:XP_003293200.1 hypothetical protein DICPUDRAFT_83777 [Dictyostelium purpureum]